MNTHTHTHTHTVSVTDQRKLFWCLLPWAKLFRSQRLQQDRCPEPQVGNTLLQPPGFVQHRGNPSVACEPSLTATRMGRTSIHGQKVQIIHGNLSFVTTRFAEHRKMNCIVKTVGIAFGSGVFDLLLRASDAFAKPHLCFFGGHQPARWWRPDQPGVSQSCKYRRSLQFVSSEPVRPSASRTLSQPETQEPESQRRKLHTTYNNHVHRISKKPLSHTHVRVSVSFLVLSCFVAHALHVNWKKHTMV